MPTELPVSALASYTTGFAEPAAKLASSSIAAGNTAGRLWSEKANDPAAALAELPQLSREAHGKR